MANLSVVAKQPTAVFRAMPEFSLKGIAAMGKLLTTKADIQEMIEHSGLAQMKAWGFSENATAKSVGELYDKNSRTWRTKMSDLPFLNLAEKADLITWAAIWRAAKADTRSISEATEKFNEVIRRTQVVKSAFTTAPITEQKGFAKLAFAFKNEPLKTLNYMRATMSDIASGKEGAKMKGAKVAVAVAMNSVVVAMISSAFSMGRDEEDDSLEIFGEKFSENFLSDMLSNFTIFGGDAFEAFVAGLNMEAIERMDLAVFVEAGELAQSIYDRWNTPESEQKYTLKKILYDASHLVSDVSGIPIGNAVRALRSLGYLYIDLTDDPVAKYNMAKVWYNVEGIDNSSVRAKFKSILTQALDDGDYASFETIREDLRAHGFGAKDIQTAVANSTRLYDAWNEGAATFRAEINRAVKSSKTLTSDYVMKAFKSKKSSLVNDLFDAMKAGGKKEIANAKEALLNHRDTETLRKLSKQEVDQLLLEKLERAIESEVENRLVDLYGTDSYDDVKRKILNEYRNFDLITSEYIDKLVRAIK